MSVIQATITTLTPPSSSHGSRDPWLYPATAGADIENTIQEKRLTAADHDTIQKVPLGQTNGNIASIPTEFASTEFVSTEPPPQLRYGGAIKLQSSRVVLPAHSASAVVTEPKPPVTVTVTPVASPAEQRSPSANGGLYNPLKKRNNPEAGAEPGDDFNSKWIHRDKLARIENEELQAAGFIVPVSAAAIPRPRRDRSSENLNSVQKSPETAHATLESAPASASNLPSKPKNLTQSTEPRPIEASVPSWDLRLPEEIMAETQMNPFWPPNCGARASRIPLSRLSLLPPLVDKTNGDSPTESDSISVSRTRSRSASLRSPPPEQNRVAASKPGSALSSSPAKRSVTDLSLRNGAATSATAGTTRKTSAPVRGRSTSAATASTTVVTTSNTMANSSHASTVSTSNGSPSNTTSLGRPRTRGGVLKDAGSAGIHRPRTRSGDLSLRAPEGEPPWMVSAYKPDPRLPPDQQILPTVARRLQQEKWEREGIFGNIYDKDFRPLTSDGFPEKPPSPPETNSALNPIPDDASRPEDEDWPLKTEGIRSPKSLLQGSYTTMPKIQDKPMITLSPILSPSSAVVLQLLPSPRSQQTDQDASKSGPPVVAMTASRPEPVKKKRGGLYGCCNVM